MSSNNSAHVRSSSWCWFVARQDPKCRHGCPSFNPAEQARSRRVQTLLSANASHAENTQHPRVRASSLPRQQRPAPGSRDRGGGEPNDAGEEPPRRERSHRGGAESTAALSLSTAEQTRRRWRCTKQLFLAARSRGPQFSRTLRARERLPGQLTSPSRAERHARTSIGTTTAAHQGRPRGAARVPGEGQGLRVLASRTLSSK